MRKSKAVLTGLIALLMMSSTACGSAGNSTGDSSDAESQNASIASTTEDTKADSEEDTEADSDKRKNENGNESKDAAVNVKENGDNVSSQSSEKTESMTDEKSEDNKNGEPNSYGYYEETNPPMSGVSVAALTGSWIDTGIGTENLTVTSGDDLYKGNFSFRNDEGKVVTGYVRLEYSLTSDNEKKYWYTFYLYDGTLWNAFVVDGSIPLDDLYENQSDERAFHRTDSASEESDENIQNVTEIGAYVGSYSEGKGVLTFNYDGLTKSFNVIWPLGAGETREWNFTAEFDDVDTFYYSDCVKNVTKYDENGGQTTEQEYSGGTGSVTVSKNDEGTYIFIWNDNQENIAEGSVFIKI